MKTREQMSIKKKRKESSSETIRCLWCCACKLTKSEWGVKRCERGEKRKECCVFVEMKTRRWERRMCREVEEGAGGTIWILVESEHKLFTTHEPVLRVSTLIPQRTCWTPDNTLYPVMFELWCDDSVSFVFGGLARWRFTINRLTEGKWIN